MDKNLLNPQHWLQHSSVVHDAQAVEMALQQLTQAIQSRISAPIILMCVMRGGLYLAGQLLARLTVPMQVDYVQANRYSGTQGQQVVWRQRPSLNLSTQIVLIVDDILDEGVTLAEVASCCRNMGAKSVFTAVLTEKNNGLNKPLQADFVGLIVPDAYVFGCGMDVHGWWRNLPEIRSLNPKA